VTVFIVSFLLDNIGDPASRLFFGYLPDSIRDAFGAGLLLEALSTVVVVALITAFGLLSKYVIGKVALASFERMIARLPFVSTVYLTAKQIIETFSKHRRAVFQKTVLVEFPRKGLYSIGFLTSEAGGEIQSRTGAHVVNVFVPTTPNPTSGFLVMVPKEDVTLLDMTVADGMKLIISGGAMVPPWQQGPAQPPSPPLPPTPAGN
jgi:uncharacterized membrane protein